MTIFYEEKKLGLRYNIYIEKILFKIMFSIKKTSAAAFTKVLQCIGERKRYNRCFRIHRIYITFRAQPRYLKKEKKKTFFYLEYCVPNKFLNFCLCVHRKLLFYRIPAVKTNFLQFRGKRRRGKKDSVLTKISSGEEELGKNLIKLKRTKKLTYLFVMEYLRDHFLVMLIKKEGKLFKKK